MDWKDKAKEILKEFYQRFEGSQWHKLELKIRTDLLLAKVCFAIFGEPTKVPTDENDLSTAYDEEQKKLANRISEHLLNRVYKDVQANEFMFKVIYIVCKEEEKDKPHVQPLFCLFADGDPENPDCGRRYVDMSCRTYKDWTDWKENNTLPMMQYAYPKYGFFSCSNYCRYEFDEKKEPNIEFGVSPRSSIGAQFARKADIATSITGLVSGGMIIASMFTPIGPAVMFGSAIAGGTSALWGTGRSVGRLVDKGKHDEDMFDLESWTHYLSLVAAPLAFSSSIFSARIAQGAIAESRIFSSSMRTFVTTLNFASLGVSGTLVGIGFVNLVEKHKADNLTTLDVVQFSMSVFFFTNTLIKPQLATNIIRDAQSDYFKNVESSLNTDSARKAFQQVMDNNKGSGSIYNRSKIVRGLNNLTDKNATFNRLGINYDKIEFSRKGKTLLLSHDGETTRVSGNQRVLEVSIPSDSQPKFSASANSKLEKVIDQHPDNVLIGGEQVFKNASTQEKARASRVMNENHKEVVQLGLKVSDELGVNNVHNVLDIIEIVSAECKELKDTQNFNRAQQLSHIEENMPTFIENIENDMLKAEEIQERTGLGFKTPLSATYHYRKHFKEFTDMDGQDAMEFYLGHIPEELINNYHDVRIENFPNGDVRRTYVTPKNEIAVTVENVAGEHRINTMHEHRGAYAKFNTDFNSYLSQNPGITSKFRIPEYSYMHDLHKHIFLATGQTLQYLHLTLSNGKRFRFNRHDHTFQLLQ